MPPIPSKQRGWGLVILVGVAAVLAAFLFFERIVDEKKEHARLMKQCMDDGKPEYECHVLLKPDVKPQPIVIPVPIQ